MKTPNNCVGVPLKVLALEGEGGATTEPAIGDEVEFTVKGKVTSVQNGEAYVQAETANGEPVVGEKAAAPSEEEPTDDSLRSDAEAADQTNMI